MARFPAGAGEFMRPDPKLSIDLELIVARVLRDQYPPAE